MNQYGFMFLKKIEESIEKEKNLKIIKLHESRGSFGQFINVEDKSTQKQYTIKIISVFNGIDDVCPQKLENAKKEADFLKQCSHPNIFKYLDQYQIKYHYFIQMEKVERNLEQWIKDQNEDKILRHQFISFACQILSAMKYLYKNNFLLSDMSLKNIFINRNNSIKICNFGFDYSNYSDLYKQKFVPSCSEDDIIYFPPELINLSYEQISQQNKGCIQIKSKDIWSFGMCFYILGGAKEKDCINAHISNYKYISTLDEDLNKILSSVLSLSAYERPTVEQILLTFESLRKKIWTSQQARNLYNKYQIIKEQNLEKALNLILLCTEISTGNIEYQLQQGHIQCKLSYSEEAIQSYQKYLEINPSNISSYYYLGNAYFGDRVFDKAIQSYLKCLETDPFNCIYYNSLGNAYNSSSMVDQAIKSYQKCLKINPQYSICYYNYGNVKQNMGVFSEAIYLYQKCLQINPVNDKCYFSLGFTYNKIGRISSAIQSYKKCLEINPSNDSCYQNLGETYHNQGKVNEAIKSFQKCLEINPNNDLTYFNAGIAYQKKGKFDESLRALKNSLRLNPNNQACEEEIKKCKQKI